MLYASRGEYVKARDSLLLAINTHPTYATAHENLGDIYAKMAELAYDKALQLDGENESAKAKLALMTDLISIEQPAGRSTTQVGVVATAEGGPEPMVDAVVDERGDDAIEVVRNWAQAWSNQDIDQYLGFYSPDFVPSHGVSRSAWASARRDRLKQPSFIQIDVSDEEIDFKNNERVRITFIQGYQSDTYSDRVRKALVLVMKSGQWKIIRESTLE